MDITELEKLFKSDASDRDCFMSLMTFIRDNQDDWSSAINLAAKYRKQAFEGDWTQRLLRAFKAVMPEEYQEIIPPNIRPDYH